MKTLILLFVALLFMAPALRLLAEARRTRRAPEFWAALYFFGAGIGLPLRLYGSSVFETQPELASTLNLFGHLFFGSGTIAMTIFTWRVFHPDHRSARVFAILTIGAIVTTTIYSLVAGLESNETSAAMMGMNLARLVPTYWACFESYKYWRGMRKRMTIGLGDPVTTNRFLLWAIWTFAISILPTVALSLRILEKIVSASDPSLAVSDYIQPAIFAMRLLFLLIAPVAVAAISLSFFPPSRYLERVRAGAPAASPA